MKKSYKLNITFTQVITRFVSADSDDEAENIGYQIAKETAELKALNIDVDISHLAHLPTKPNNL